MHFYREKEFKDVKI